MVVGRNSEQRPTPCDTIIEEKFLDFRSTHEEVDVAAESRSV